MQNYRRPAWEARARAARVQTAAKTLWWVVVVVVRTPTLNYLRQASPDRGKYLCLGQHRGPDPDPDPDPDPNPDPTQLCPEAMHDQKHGPAFVSMVCYPYDLASERHADP